MFVIDADRNISFWEGEPPSDAISFDSQIELLNVAEQNKWSKDDVTAIWNSFAGVAPFGELKTLKCFRHRPYGIERIWIAIQRLDPNFAAVTSVVSPYLEEAEPPVEQTAALSPREYHIRGQRQASSAPSDAPAPKQKRGKAKRAKPIAFKHRLSKEGGFKARLRDAIFAEWRVGQSFTLADVYGNWQKEFQKAFPNDSNVTAQFRKNLQALRDAGFVEFIGRGAYKLVSKKEQAAA